MPISKCVDLDNLTSPFKVKTQKIFLIHHLNTTYFMLVHYDMFWTLINFTIKKIIKNNKEINKKKIIFIE